MTSQSPNPSPLLYANRWSRFFHSWISHLLTHSQKHGTLHLTDLYDIPSDLESTKITEQFEASWLDELKQYPQNPSLIRATLRFMGWKPLLIGFLLIPISIFHIAQPLVLIFLMNFFEQCSTMSNWMAWLLAATNVFITICASLLMHQYIYRTSIHAMKMRIAYTGLIYRKLLRLSSHSINTLNSGRIANLMSSDAGQIEMTLFYINYLWITPFGMTLVMIVFWKFVRYIIFIAIGYAFVLLFIQAFLSRLILHFRIKILRATDERVKIMSEIIKLIRIVKMYCWESAFSNKIQRIRKNEIVQCAFRLMIDCIQTLLSHTYMNVTLTMMYATMWSLNIQFDTRFFAIAMCMLGYIRLNAVHFFTSALRNLVQYLASRKRIETFLLLSESERDDRLKSSSCLNFVTASNKQSMMKLSKLKCNIKRAQWETNGSFSLQDVMFSACPGDLVCVIGSVGSGKSSLLQTISGEITIFEGKIRLCGSFCYVPQEPWIFSSTIKENILFGKEYDHELFQRVVCATALDTDFNQWPHGSNTSVGDQGLTLSGGQKARVNMARALYRDADIYLLDDPLSAVDVKVSKQLFEKSIKEYLGNKICILTTHQVQFLQDATTIILLKNGSVTHIGSYEQLLASSSSSITDLFANIHQFDREEQHPTDLQKQLPTVDSIVPKSQQEKSTLNSSTNIAETKKEGIIKWHVYISYLRAGVGLLLGFILIFTIFSVREMIAIFSDRWLAMWNDDESHRYRVFNNCTNIRNNKIKSMNNIDWNNYRNQRFYIYCGTVLALVIITLLRVVITEFICLNAGRVVHNKMFSRFIRCPISFFERNPTGRILNRFTKDVAIMDDYLPINLFDLLQYLFKALGTVILVGWINPWSFIPAVIATIGMIHIRQHYARCLRDLKRIEGISWSPFFSYLTSTCQGLKVIRSYHAEQICSAEFHSYLNDNTRANYLICTVNRWAAIRFDWTTLTFFTLVTFLAMIMRITQRQITAGDIALILSYCVSLIGTLPWAIRLSVDVETQMTAVERILEYCTLDQEPPAQLSPDRRPPPNWPSQGRIVFNNVSMCHSTDDMHSPLALRHISVIIESGKKVGIVGRTGAGKSSLIQTLFRMGALVDGQIEIDNIDIASVGLDDIRNRIVIIPQDPVLFTDTLRTNLDPFGTYSDTELWDALEQVQLKTWVKEGMLNGLESVVNENGSNLSVGQKQMICLARAILKKSRILIMDEATANVDNATDKLIQRAIREKFRNCTVLTIAHRLRTVIDYDLIMVLDNGELLECDRPDVLLSNPTSHFTSLVKQTGMIEAEHLQTLANTVAITRKPKEQKLNGHE